MPVIMWPPNILGADLNPFVAARFALQITAFRKSDPAFADHPVEVRVVIQWKGDYQFSTRRQKAAKIFECRKDSGLILRLLVPADVLKC